MNQKTIRVQGNGSVSQVPDRIRLVFSITRNDKDFARSVENCNAAIEEIRSAARGCGIDPDGLKSVHFNVSETTESSFGLRQHRLFHARHQVAIDLPIDQTLAGRFLAAVLRGGALPEVDVEFRVSDPEDLKQRVLADAVGNARRRAETIAGASGVALGRIESIEYGYGEVKISSRRGHMVVEGPVASGPALEFVPEEIRAEDTVTITWEIIQ